MRRKGERIADAQAGEQIAIPLSSTEYSQINAEFIYRGSSIAPTNQTTLRAATNKREDAAAVEHYMEAITDGRRQPPTKRRTGSGTKCPEPCPCWPYRRRART